MATRPYTTCPCAPDHPCVACPLAHACSCGSDVAQRCRRPSGHRGHFVMTHEDRLLRSDADAMKAWARALRGLARNTQIWQGRIDPVLLERYITLADPAAAPQQLTLLPSPRRS